MQFLKLALLSRSIKEFRGHQNTFTELVKSSRKKTTSEGCGTINVDITKPVVYQLWDEFKGFTSHFNSEIITLLKLYGIEEEHLLSILAQNFKSQDHLINCGVQTKTSPFSTRHII